MMNTLVSFCFVVVLAQCVLANNIYSPYVKAKMAQNAIEEIDTSDHGLREKRQITNQPGGPCRINPMTGRCVPFLTCSTVYKPDFNVYVAAMQDPCASVTDICCLESEIRNIGA